LSLFPICERLAPESSMTAVFLSRHVRLFLSMSCSVRSHFSGLWNAIVETHVRMTELMPIQRSSYREIGFHDVRSLQITHDARWRLVCVCNKACSARDSLLQKHVPNSCRDTAARS
jgi:hypothetical protein